MDYLKIGRITEADFDEMIVAAGGRRYVADHSAEQYPNADYILNEAILELKLIEEEGLNKNARQKKIAELFRLQQPERPVIVLSPDLLDEDSQHTYDNAMAGPIKTAVKQAAKQLQSTQTRLGDNRVRVLIAINVGYTALSHDEFRRIVLKRIRSDTRKIDCAVVGGIYHYSDKFDSYVIFPFEECPIIVGRRFSSFDALKLQWDAFTEALMTDVIKGTAARIFDKMPVIDLKYEINDVTYLKPAPRIGKPSDFWRDGRPRENSSGITMCPPVAQTFPDLDYDNWQRFKEQLPDEEFFKDTYEAWLDFRNRQDALLGTTTKPFVPVVVTCSEAIAWCHRNNCTLSVRRLCEYASSLFDQRVREVLRGAKCRSQCAILVPSYVYLLTEEIGQDKANDLSSISLVRETTSGTQRTELVRNARLFYEVGLALSAAYAVKYGVNTVMYDKDLTFAWV